MEELPEKPRGMTSEDWLRKHGKTPCYQCIWFKGEVVVYCANHQAVLDRMRRES